MPYTHGPLELTAQARATAVGVAIRVAPPGAGAQQWADVWLTAEELSRWLQDIDAARKQQEWEQQGVAHLLALQRILDGLPSAKARQEPPGPETADDRLCQDCGHPEHSELPAVPHGHPSAR